MAPPQGEQLVLRDIHLPQPVSWWPLAPGWWILAAIVIVIILASLFALHRHRQRRYRRIALQQLNLLEKSFCVDHNHQHLMQELSKLLRHMAVLHYPPRQCAGLYGEKWLNFLDQTLGNKRSDGNQHHPFSAGVGRCLADAPYQTATEKNITTLATTADTPENNCTKQADTETIALIQLSRRWLKNLPPATPNGSSQ